MRYCKFCQAEQGKLHTGNGVCDTNTIVLRKHTLRISTPTKLTATRTVSNGCQVVGPHEECEYSTSTVPVQYVNGKFV